MHSSVCVFLTSHGHVTQCCCFSELRMEKYNLLLSLCSDNFSALEPTSVEEAAKFDSPCIVKGVSCFYKSVTHQELAVNCTNIRQLLRYFKNWGEEKHNLCAFPETWVLTALMPRIKNLQRYDSWFNSAIIPVSSVHDPILLVATGNCVTGWHRDDDPPTEVIASLLRGRKIWVFASKGSREAAQLPSVREANNFEYFIEGVIYKRFRGLTYCVQEVGDTVCLPARTGHLVLSMGPNESWNVLLSHNIRHSPAVAARLEIRCWNVTRGSKERIHQGLRGKRRGVTGKRFGARKHRIVPK